MFFDIMEATLTLSIMAFCAVGIWAIIKLTNRSTVAMKSLFVSLIDSVKLEIDGTARTADNFAKELKQKVSEL